MSEKLVHVSNGFGEMIMTENDYLTHKIIWCLGAVFFIGFGIYVGSILLSAV